MRQAFNFRGSGYLALFVLGCTALFLLSQWFLAAYPHSVMAGLADLVGFWSALFGVVSIATMFWEFVKHCGRRVMAIYKRDGVYWWEAAKRGSE